MFPIVKRHRIGFLLSAAGLALLLSAGQACAQPRTLTRQGAHCQRQGQPNSQQQLNALRTSLQRNLQQLNALEQTGQLTTVQLQAVNQLQSAMQNALQQLGTVQNGNSIPSQLQILAQQQTGPGLPLRAGPMLSRR